MAAHHSMNLIRVFTPFVCQISLFESEQSRKMKEMEKAVDQIRSKFGTDIIKRASFLKKDTIVDHAASKQKHLSSRSKERKSGSEAKKERND